MPDVRLKGHSSDDRCGRVRPRRQGYAGQELARRGGVLRLRLRRLLLAALVACMIKGIDRVTPILRFDLRGVEVRLHGARQDVPPRMEAIDYEILIDTDESDHRLELLHDNVKKYGTIFNTVAPGTELNGTIQRAER